MLKRKIDKLNELMSTLDDGVKTQMEELVRESTKHAGVCPEVDKMDEDVLDIIIAVLSGEIHIAQTY